MGIACLHATLCWGCQVNESMAEKFIQQALQVLEDNPGKKYCYPCWLRAAGMTAVEHLQQLSAVAAAFVKSSDRIAEHGTCRVCGKTTWIVLKLP